MKKPLLFGLLGSILGLSIGATGLVLGLAYALTGYSWFGIAGAYYGFAGLFAGIVIFALAFASRRRVETSLAEETSFAGEE